ncbi:MAG: short-chain dehydrogenase [Rhodospirillaceae bacterium]|jgi:NAD(P)-dependent dehydrogenase (short-subunit alcohol dehydrogenase family)|nr:short-chain dehydrogenase [Rhodospirillaceae bacterium]|tara:strand:+ start:89 stop:772 length:684 start_codon:yes stop_codon:yes gene_type:complete
MPTVLITGASRGLGLEFARQYADDGWSVIASCRQPKKAKSLNAVAGDVTVMALDVDDLAKVKALARKLKGRGIDVLINNAGIYGPKGLTRDNVDYDAWGRVFRTNAMSPLAVSAAFAANVAQGRQKKIVTLSSIMGSIDSNTDGKKYIYRSSKAAVNAVMKSLSLDLAAKGIKVVMLHPGWVRTDMGGPKGAIDAAQSVTGMRAVIAGLKKSDSGRFLNYEGTEIPW